jgi:hypothetical protein
VQQVGERGGDDSVAWSVRIQANFLYLGYYVDVETISLQRGVDLSRYGITASFFHNRFAGIRRSKILSWWVCFMLDEPLPGKFIFPIDTFS